MNNINFPFGAAEVHEPVIADNAVTVEINDNFNIVKVAAEAATTINFTAHERLQTGATVLAILSNTGDFDFTMGTGIRGGVVETALNIYAVTFVYDGTDFWKTSEVLVEAL